jgi:HemY protein
MRPLIWILLLFAAAVAVALALANATGYVLVVWPPHRIELTLALTVILLLAAFAAFHLAWRFLAQVLTLPSEVRAYRARKRRERARTTFSEALRALFEGRLARARRAAEAASALDEGDALSAVVAARAAHGLRDAAGRDAWLARAAEGGPEVATARAIAEAEMALEERRPQDALTALGTLPDRHTAALRLELRAQQQLKQWDAVLALLDQLARRGVFDDTQTRELKRAAHIENLKRKALDRHALTQYWDKLPAADRRDAKIALTAAQCFGALGGAAQAHAAIEQALDAEWDSALAAAYAECPGSDTVAQIERAEKWLRNEPRDAALLLTLGRLCALERLWGKAQSYLEASLSVEPTWTAHQELARLHEHLGNADAATRHTKASLELALAALQEASGGRRRSTF